MKKPFVPITIVCGILALLAIGGQFVSAPSEATPVRLRMANKGGEVVFSHIRHEEYAGTMGKDCASCHHDGLAPDQAPLPCTSCHVEEFNDKFVAEHATTLPQETCTRCHHREFGKKLWNHQEHVDQYAGACTDCHHGTDIEAEPGNCNQCHGETADGDTPSLRDAVHQRCASCHQDMFDQKMTGCKNCHEELPGQITPAEPKCTSCHYETDGIPLPTTMAAYHGQCMGCHEEAGSGPFGDKSCTRCHTR